jgi:hypothetical protein
MRIAWSIALSIFVIIRINDQDMIKKNGKEWRTIRDLTIIVMAFSTVYIIAFIFGILYQPQEYVREMKFDNIMEEYTSQAKISN